MEMLWQCLIPHLSDYFKAIRAPYGNIIPPTPTGLRPYLDGATPNIFSALHLIAQSITVAFV